jgi:hypothetical protein
MFTSINIEKKVKAFKTKIKKDPRFIVMDQRSYDTFSQSFKPIERIQFFGERDPEEKMRLTSFYVENYRLEFLIIDRKKPFMEIAG